MSDRVVGLVHIIPRYRGDSDHPRGGIRGVMPHKRDYESLFFFPSMIILIPVLVIVPAPHTLANSDITSRSSRSYHRWYASATANRALLRMLRQTSSSACRATSSADDADAVGTATTMRAGCIARILSSAASIVKPDASPSSVRMTDFPASVGNGLPAVYRAIRPCTFRRVAAIAASTCTCDSPSAARSRSLISTRPSQVTDPKPASVLPGTWTLRTIASEKGAPSASATSTPTGTPPAGIASTTGPARAGRDRMSAPSFFPASCRSEKTNRFSRSEGSSVMVPIHRWCWQCRV